MAKNNAKANVGDKVVYKRGGWYEPGTILYVLKYDGSDYAPYKLGVRPDSSPADYDSLWVDAKDFEVIEKATTGDPKFKIGDKVRILDVDSILFGDEFLKDSDVVEVIDVDSEGDITVAPHRNSGATTTIWSSELHAVEKVQTKEEAGHSALLSRILALELRVAKLEGEKKDDSLDALRYVDFVPLIPTKTPNERRKEAIEKAKMFVANVVARGTDGNAFNDNTGGNHTYQNRFYMVDFVVNEDKRTVVALVHHTNYRGDFVERAAHKGIAKCAPSDVFNVDIGKAIAIGRAFGLDTTDFEMAPQPSEYEDGQVVTFPKEDSWHRRVNYVVDGIGSRSDNLRIIKNEMTDEFGGMTQVGARAYAGSGSYLTIISDTEAEY